MSVKTCQLCGKPLGRRGSDGEFCSKEHRNQSQLRRGLDRLEEADKVATLMRRRENPRPIPAEQLMTPGTCEARATTESAPYPARQQELRIQPLQAALFQPRIARHEDRFSNPLSELTRRSGVPATRLATPASLPFVARRTTPALEPQNSTIPAAGVVRASSTPIRCHVAATKGDARECGAALRMARRPVAPQRQTAPLTAAAGTLEKARQFQALTLAALGAGAGEIRIHAGRTFAKRSL